MSQQKYYTFRDVIIEIPCDEGASTYSNGVHAIFTIIRQEVKTILDFTPSFISNIANNNIKTVLNHINLPDIISNNQGMYIIIDGDEPTVTCQEIIQ